MLSQDTVAPNCFKSYTNSWWPNLFQENVLSDFRFEIHLVRRNIISTGQSVRALKSILFRLVMFWFPEIILKIQYQWQRRLVLVYHICCRDGSLMERFWLGFQSFWGFNKATESSKDKIKAEYSLHWTNFRQYQKTMNLVTAKWLSPKPMVFWWSEGE